MKSIITGMGMYLPERIYSSEEVEEMAGYKKFGIKQGVVKMLTGCEKRHFAAEDEYCSDLAAKAGREALEDANISASDIDAVIFCSITQDFAEPATVNVVMDKLDIRNAFSFDVKNACNAFLSGLDVADSLVKTEKAENVLVVSGEALSKWTKFDYQDKDTLLQRGTVALSVGDGGGAFVVSKGTGEDGICASQFKTIPEVWNNNVIWGGGVVYPNDPDKLYIPGTTKKLVDMHQDVTKNFVPPVLEKSGWKTEDIDCVLVSQVAKWMTRNIRNILNLSQDKMIETVTYTGNVGAANIPIMACESKRKGILGNQNRVVMLGGAVGANLGAMTAII